MESLIQQTAIIPVPYDDALRNEWDEFVENKAINNTFLHTRKFFDHDPLNAVDDASLIFYKHSEIVAVLPAILYKHDGRQILHSHLRATYGGFVVSKRVGIKEAAEIVEQTIRFAREKKADQIIVRNPFRIFHSMLCDETDYAMWYHGFKIKSRELEVAVELHPNVEMTRSQYHNDAKRNVKRALKHVKIAPINNLVKFWDLLERSYNERHGKKPVHNYRSISRLIHCVGKQKVLAFGAYYNQILVGGCIVFVANQIALHGQYIAFDSEFKHLRPVHALIDHVLVYGSINGYRYFNFGMANEDEGRTINQGLFSIKEHFGGRGVLRETMSLDIK